MYKSSIPKYITRAYIQKHPNRLFIFGDNLLKQGLGGQAKECRGEPNTFGIPTKRRPSWDVDAFFTDEPSSLAEFYIALTVAFAELRQKIWEQKFRYLFIIPRMGIGLAHLQDQPKCLTLLTTSLVDFDKEFHEKKLCSFGSICCRQKEEPK